MRAKSSKCSLILQKTLATLPKTAPISLSIDEKKHKCEPGGELNT